MSTNISTDIEVSELMLFPTETVFIGSYLKRGNTLASDGGALEISTDNKGHMTIEVDNLKNITFKDTKGNILVFL